MDPKFVPAIITCCAALHNVCLGVGDIEEAVLQQGRDNVDQAPCAVEVSGARCCSKVFFVLTTDHVSHFYNGVTCLPSLF